MAFSLPFLNEDCKATCKVPGSEIAGCHSLDRAGINWAATVSL